MRKENSAMAKNNRIQRYSLPESQMKRKKKHHYLTKKNARRLLKIGFSLANLVLKLIEVAEKIQGLMQ